MRNTSDRCRFSRLLEHVTAYKLEPLEARRLLNGLGFEFFTDATLTTPGLVGSYVNTSLHSSTAQVDWRSTQSISGTRVDTNVNFTNASWGNRASVGLTGGSDTDWDDFSVQWDGYLRVTSVNTQLAIRSDDGSRLWIDINKDGVFNSSGAEYTNNGFGNSQSPTTSPYTTQLAGGVYRVRVQYHEEFGGNEFQFLSQLNPSGSTGQLSGPLDVNALLNAGQATLTASPWDIGPISNLFDGNPDTLLRTASVNPAVFTLALTTPLTVSGFRVMFTAATNRYWIESADSLADLDAQSGSYRSLAGPTDLADRVMGTVTVAPAVTASYYRLTILRLSGDDYVHAVDWLPIGTTSITNLAVTTLDPRLEPGLSSLYQAYALNTGGTLIDVTNDVTWSTDAAAVATVNATGRVSGVGAGTTDIVASVPGLSARSVVTVKQAATDLNVTHIERTPRYDYDATKNNPAAGDVVTFNGHVRNWGSSALTNVQYRWTIDGVPVETGTISFAAGEEKTLTRNWTWLTGAHTVTLEIDPNHLIAEASETNNVVSDRTDGIAIGFWVEQSTWSYFRRFQRYLGIGSMSWEDWAQRQVAQWNLHNIDARWPTSPNGVLDRVRLDKIVIVPDGALPLNGGLPGNNPAADATVDLMWGFDADLLDGDFYANTTSLEPSSAFYLEPSLIHEMGHARYLIDNYGFDVDSGQVDITDTFGSVAGSSRMPFVAWDSVLYYNKWGGVMSGPFGDVWGPYEAAALNLIAGRRAVSGNQNAPGNIGVFLQNLPASNNVKFVDEAGLPITGATVSVYRATGQAGVWYGKYFDSTPDLSFTTNANGVVVMPRNPFSDTSAITHTYGLSNGVVILRIQKDARIWYEFLEVTEFNMQYWAGNTANASYTIELSNDGIRNAREISLIGHNSVPIPNNDVTPNVVDGTDFGTASGSTHWFFVRNAGLGDLALGSNAVTVSGANPGDFIITRQPATDIGASGQTWFSVQFRPSAAGPRSATITIASNDANESAYHFNVSGTSLGPPPTVTLSSELEVAPNGVRLAFSQDVAASLSTADLMFTHDGAAIPTAQLQLVALGGNSYALRWTANSVLPDGTYQVVLNGASISNAGGVTLDGNGDGVSGDNSTLTFHVLSGDANRDRVVNFLDLLVLARNYNQTGKTLSQGNFDYSADGLVGFNDLLILAKHYNQFAVVAFVADQLRTTAPGTGSEKRRPGSVEGVIL